MSHRKAKLEIIIDSIAADSSLTSRPTDDSVTDDRYAEKWLFDLFFCFLLI